MAHKQLFFRNLQLIVRDFHVLPSHSQALITRQSKIPQRKICQVCHNQHHQRLFSQLSPTRHPGLANTTAQQASEIKQQTEASPILSSASSSAPATHLPESWAGQFRKLEPRLDWDFFLDPKNTEMIRANTANRKGVGDIDQVRHLMERFQKAQTTEEKGSTWQELMTEALNIPNTSHPQSPVGDESKARVAEVHSQKRDFDFTPRTVVELGDGLQMLRTDNLSQTTGPRTYYLLGKLALLEQALVGFTLSTLREKGFEQVSVPDLLHPDIIESCGFKTRGERTQVYHLNERHGQLCLAGTAEMSLAGLFLNEVLDIKDLPKRLMAVSRCYRAETSDIAEEKGIYRVHQFTKVEMFGVTANEDGQESEQLLQQLLDIERDLFISLGLHFRILDMPTEELGAPAHRKYDMETWMPGRGFWGEISSASNCTDFQARRLNIQYRDQDGCLKFAHTVNGTACAVPRMVMALLESNQRQDGSVVLPEVLEPWMGCRELTFPHHKDPFVRLQDRRKR